MEQTAFERIHDHDPLRNAAKEALVQLTIHLYPQMDLVLGRMRCRVSAVLDIRANKS